jgi:hypothetical protein
VLVNSGTNEQIAYQMTDNDEAQAHPGSVNHFVKSNNSGLTRRNWPGALFTVALFEPTNSEAKRSVIL